MLDGTWLQLMYCTPSRLWCPNFGGQGFDEGEGKDKSTKGYKGMKGQGARVDPELTEL